MIYAVILSGGTGTRIGKGIPKQFIKIQDKPILTYCIKQFCEVDEFDKIIVTSPVKYMDETKKLIKSYFPNEPRLIVIPGGKTRQDTLMNSIAHIEKYGDKTEDNIVINHDGARIFVSTKLIKDCIKYTKKYGAASPIIPSTDVIVEKKGDKVHKMPNRYDLVHVQTPQGFYIKEYSNLYNELTDDEIESVHEIIRVYYLKNKQIYLFEGDKGNFKVTHPIDIKIAESIIKEE